MIEYGAMVEWYWQGKTEVLGEKHIAWVVDGWVSMEQWWNDTISKKPTEWERSLSKCHYFPQIPHWMPSNKPGPPRWEASNRLPEPWHSLELLLLSINTISCPSMSVVLTGQVLISPLSLTHPLPCITSPSTNTQFHHPEKGGDIFCLKCGGQLTIIHHVRSQTTFICRSPVSIISTF